MRRWLGGLLRFGSQNLNEGGSAWREGRCWLWFPDLWLRGVWAGGLFASPAVSRVERTLEFSWAHGRKRWTDFALEWAWWPATKWRGPCWRLHVGVLGCSWWFGVPDHDSWPLVTGFYLFEDHFNLTWFHDDMSGITNVGWSRSWFLLDKLLGRARYSSYISDVRPVLVPMLERAYRGTCTLHVDTWKRPRWFARRLARATIDMEKGEAIPHPGKGENAWDCGEDATHGITLPAKTMAEAVAGMVESVLRSRERHGGSVTWVPEAARDGGGP